MQTVINNFVVILILIIIIIIITEEVNGIVNNGNILGGGRWRCYNEGNRKICYQENEFLKK